MKERQHVTENRLIKFRLKLLSSLNGCLYQKKYETNYVSVIEGPKISLENDASNTLYTLAENEYLEENDEIKEVEEDMELLELKDGEVSDNILFQFKSDNLNLPNSSPRLQTKNRRYTLRPQKKPETTECDKFTSTNDRKRSTSLTKNGCLETIFENPVLKNGSLTFVGKTKLKRYLSFDSFVSKTKLRHRKLKLKRLAKGKRKKNSSKASIEEVKLKLKSLDDEEDEWMDMQE